MPGEYLQGGAGMPAALSGRHKAMCKAAVGGPFDPDYRRERSLFLALLTEYVLVGENRDVGKTVSPGKGAFRGRSSFGRRGRRILCRDRCLPGVNRPADAIRVAADDLLAARRVTEEDASI